MSSRTPIIRVAQVTRSYGGSFDPANFMLAATSLEINAGSWTALTGRSGAGKTTLLRILSGLDRPDTGEVWMFGRNVTRASEDELTRLRRDHMGIVHQQFFCIDYLPVWCNVSIRLVPMGVPARGRRQRASRVLDQLGLPHVLDRLPHALSGGEQQRVALARALICDPTVLIVDEPTSNVDAETGAAIVRCFQECQSRGTAIVVSTHDPTLLKPAERCCELVVGRMSS